jgi:hypothetical protein
MGQSRHSHRGPITFAVGTRVTWRPPHRSVRAQFGHTACMGLSLSRRHHGISVVLCHSILLFDLRRKHSFVPTAYLHRRRAQRRSRTARNAGKQSEATTPRRSASGVSIAARFTTAEAPDGCLVRRVLGSGSRATEKAGCRVAASELPAGVKMHPGPPPPPKGRAAQL